jgi:hypothetical protein
MKATSQQKQTIEPEARGGTTTDVAFRSSAANTERGSTYIEKVLSGLRYDKNLVYLAARLQNYSDLTEARMMSLSQAITERDHAAAGELAQALTDSTGKLGAIRMMKLCIALQMLARRGLTEKAKTVFQELELEYGRFKQTLISAVG